MRDIPFENVIITRHRRIEKQRFDVSFEKCLPLTSLLLNTGITTGYGILASLLPYLQFIFN